MDGADIAADILLEALTAEVAVGDIPLLAWLGGLQARRLLVGFCRPVAVIDAVRPVVAVNPDAIQALVARDLQKLRDE